MQWGALEKQGNFHWTEKAPGQGFQAEPGEKPIVASGVCNLPWALVCGPTGLSFPLK